MLSRNAAQLLLINAWLLGDYLQAPTFQNSIMNSLISRIPATQWSLLTPFGNHIFANTTQHSVLRKLVIEEALFGRMEDLSTEASFEPFVHEIAVALAAKIFSAHHYLLGVIVPYTRVVGKPSYLHNVCCSYHVHYEGSAVCGQSAVHGQLWAASRS